LALSENSVVGPRASGFLSGKDGEAGDIGIIVDGAPDVHRDSQAENKPLEARSSFQTEPSAFCPGTLKYPHSFAAEADFSLPGPVWWQGFVIL